MTTRQWQTFVEIDVSICSLTYGTAPCAAAIGVTGTQRCFNTRGSSQDLTHYAETFVTLRFALDTGSQAESGIDYVSDSLVSVDLRPGIVSLGENLGQRPSVTCTFRDHAHSDAGPGFDKYLSTRSYDPFKQGTFWAKFASRHPNLRGKKLRVIQGWVGQALAEMDTRHYIIDSADGPGLDGTFTITAKDPLKSLDGERAMAPPVSPGYLNGAITSSATSATLAPAGIGSSGAYPTPGSINIGGEIVNYTRSGDVLTLTRGQRNTTAAAHAAGDRCQWCLIYAALDPAAIIKDLEVNYGSVDTATIPIADWLTETATYNGQVYTGFIPEPTPVKTLVAELIEQAGLAHWWDEVGEAMRLQVLRAIGTDAQLFDETSVYRGSLKITAQPDKRKSEVWTYFAQVNPVKGIALDNLPGVTALVDSDSEANYGSPLLKVIASRWIPTGGRLIADRLNQIQLGRYLSPPRAVEFQLVISEDTELPVVGGGYRVSAPMIQGGDGARVDLPFTVTGIKVKDGLCTVYGEELNWTELRVDPYNRVLTIDYNNYNLNWRTLHDNAYGTPQAGGTVTLQIASNARVGSTSASTFALDTGTWPSVAFTATRSLANGILTGISNTAAFVIGQAVTGAGIPDDARVTAIVLNTSVTIDKTPTIAGSASLTLWTTILKLVNAGQIIGRGGKGGDGAGGDNNTGGTGGTGGTGLKIQAPIELSGAGKVDGGGGGGGGGGGDYRGFFGPQQNGGGGGGGAGDLGGNGGGIGGSDAKYGSPGTVTAGGSGGKSNFSNFRGGNGGAPGANGSNAVGDFAGTGGSAGKSVDGLSLLKDTAFTGAYRGPQV